MCIHAIEGGMILKEISAGGVIYNKENNQLQLLLIEDKCHKWTLPKGKNEEGESYQETAIREIKEETGINGEIIKHIDKVYYEYYHPNSKKVEKEVYFFLVKAVTKNIKVQLSEINAAEWFSLEEAWERQQAYGYGNNDDVIKKALKELGYKVFNLGEEE